MAIARSLITTSLILCCTATFAKKIRAPLPDAVLQARTVYLVNRTGKQMILDSAYSEFEKWGRLKIVQNKSADLTVIFSRASADGEGSATRMEVHVAGDADAAYETTENVTTGPGMYALVIHDASARRCVDDFRKRVEQR